MVARVNVQQNVANTFRGANLPIGRAICVLVYWVGGWLGEDPLLLRTVSFRFVPFALLAHRSLTTRCRLLGCLACMPLGADADVDADAGVTYD